LPDQTFWRILGSLLQHIVVLDSTSDIEPIYRLVSYLLQLSRFRRNSSSVDEATQALLTSSLLRAWMICGVSSADSTLVTFLLEMETALCLRLRNFFSSPALYEYDCESIARKCIETKIARKLHNLPLCDCLLTAIILSDSVLYGPAFLRVHETLSSDVEYKEIVIMGSLDDILYTVLRCKDVVNIHETQVVSISSLFNDRMARMSEDVIFQGNGGRFFAIVLLLLHSTHYGERMNLVLLRSILIRYVEASAGKRQLVIYDEFVEVALFICLNSSNDVDGVTTLSSRMLVYLCESLIVLLRVSRIDGNLRDDPSTLRYFIWLERLLSSDIHFDSQHLEQKGVAFLNGLIKSCLRVGIALGDFRSEDVRLSCLKFVRTLVNLMQEDSSSLNCVGALLKPSISSQTFTMVTSHSKFYALMTSQQYYEVQVHVLRILLACLTSNHMSQFDRNIWTSLLTSFHAGVHEKDFLLRLVLMKYSKVAAKVSACPFVELFVLALTLTYKMHYLCRRIFKKFLWTN
jgi:hypothetical protein